jgi:hypothetical protein
MRNKELVVANFVDADLRFLFVPIGARRQANCQLTDAGNDVLIAAFWHAALVVENGEYAAELRGAERRRDAARARAPGFAANGVERCRVVDVGDGEAAGGNYAFAVT